MLYISLIGTWDVASELSYEFDFRMHPPIELPPTALDKYVPMVASSLANGKMSLAIVSAVDRLHVSELLSFLQNHGLVERACGTWELSVAGRDRLLPGYKLSNGRRELMRWRSSPVKDMPIFHLLLALEADGWRCIFVDKKRRAELRKKPYVRPESAKEFYISDSNDDVDRNYFILLLTCAPLCFGAACCKEFGVCKVGWWR